MPISSSAGRPAAALARLLDILSFIPGLLARLMLGMGFYQTGSGKLARPDQVADFFRSLNIPMPELNAAFVSRLELYGGLLLVAGLLTRPTAFLLASTMVVALLTADRGDLLDVLHGVGEKSITDVAPLPYLVPLLFLVFQGAGRFSLDGAIRERIGERVGELLGLRRGGHAGGEAVAYGASWLLGGLGVLAGSFFLGIDLQATPLLAWTGRLLVAGSILAGAVRLVLASRGQAAPGNPDSAR